MGGGVEWRTRELDSLVGVLSAAVNQASCKIVLTESPRSCHFDSMCKISKTRSDVSTTNNMICYVRKRD